ncbi:Uncharacterised protein [Mycobacterium tuberculosis]|uniref:Uncharacterized protein n=1 Tax=Mycobacterium tuberculosis TaxID=1773 RepID=A0A655APH9_MYCTX|nr:Uncharacterised protein [Mycobacterium tuberculosis]CKT49364.1 Uncharacterised protein [Mycobacterium tuberculosis]COW60358.1 Uncharacterised protein [Mycobacterium tuberculosis]
MVQLCGTDNAPTNAAWPTPADTGAAPPKGPQCGSGSSVAELSGWPCVGPSPPAFPYRPMCQGLAVFVIASAMLPVAMDAM